MGALWPIQKMDWRWCCACHVSGSFQTHSSVRYWNMIRLEVSQRKLQHNIRTKIGHVQDMHRTPKKWYSITPQVVQRSLNLTAQPRGATINRRCPTQTRHFFGGMFSSSDSSIDDGTKEGSGQRYHEEKILRSVIHFTRGYTLTDHNSSNTMRHLDFF